MLLASLPLRFVPLSRALAMTYSYNYADPSWKTLENKQCAVMRGALRPVTICSTFSSTVPELGQLASSLSLHTVKLAIRSLCQALDLTFLLNEQYSP